MWNDERGLFELREDGSWNIYNINFQGLDLSDVNAMVKAVQDKREKENGAKRERTVIPETEDEVEIIRDFVFQILHGSVEHRQWLIDAAEAYIHGEEIPNERTNN